MLSEPMIDAAEPSEELREVLSPVRSKSASLLLSAFSSRICFGSVLATDLILAAAYILARPYMTGVETAASETLGVPMPLCRLIGPTISLVMLNIALETAMAYRTLAWRAPLGMRRRVEQGALVAHEGGDSLSWKIGKLFLGIGACIGLGMICLRPHAGLALLLLAALPLAVALPQDMFVDYLLFGLRSSLEAQVKELRDRVKQTALAGSGGQAAQGTSWCSLLEEYMSLRKEFHAFGGGVGPLLLASNALNAWASFLFLMLSLDPALALGWRCVAVLCCVLSAGVLLYNLEPLAQIMHLCQSTAVDADSLLTAATSGFNGDEGISQDRMAFITYVRNFPTGIALPGGIQVTYALLLSCSRVLALYGSTAAYLCRRVLSGKSGAPAAPL